MQSPGRVKLPGRSSSSGQLRPPSPMRRAPDSPLGTSLTASDSLYAEAKGHGVQISKKIVMCDALLVEDMRKRKFNVWTGEQVGENPIWREQNAPKDESLFITLSMSVAIDPGGLDRPLPRELAKSVVRKVLRQAWIPDLQWNAFDSEYPPFPYGLIDSPSYVYDILSATQEVLVSEPQLVEITAPVRVYGDLHGQFLDLVQFFHLFGSPDRLSGDVHHNKYLFLGDFCDRGFFSLEVILLLFSLKILYPKQIILVRGNHETRGMNCKHGFSDELTSKLGQIEGVKMHEAFNAVFDHLPLCALINKKILCMHGGLGPNVQSVAQIRTIPKPLVSSTVTAEDQTWANLAARDLLWSDPSLSCDKGFQEHAVRGDGVFKIGADKVMEFLTNNGIELVMRGHECLPLGYGFSAFGRVVTVFSAINYCGDSLNAGAIVDVGADLLCVVKVVKHTQDPARAMLLVRGEDRLRESMHEGEAESGGPTLVALFDFQAEKPLELTMKRGDVIKVLNDENPEWLWVQNAQGNSGYAPRAFIGRR